MLYHFYLEFEAKFKSFVKFGLNTLYNKMEIELIEAEWRIYASVI